jgi:hypothetical protein
MIGAAHYSDAQPGNLFRRGRVQVSPDGVFDASLVPETCRDQFVDSKELIKQVSGECRITGHFK